MAWPTCCFLWTAEYSPPPCTLRPGQHWIYWLETSHAHGKTELLAFLVYWCMLCYPLRRIHFQFYRVFSFWPHWLETSRARSFSGLFVHVFYPLWRIHFQFSRVISFGPYWLETSCARSFSWLFCTCILLVVTDTLSVWESFQFLDHIDWNLMSHR